MRLDRDHEYVFPGILSVEYPLNSNDLHYVVYARSDQALFTQRRANVRLQGLGSGLDEAAAHDRPDFCHLRTIEECS